LRNKAITEHRKPPGLRQKLFEKKNKFEQLKVPRMSHADMSACLPHRVTVFTAPRYRLTKQTLRNIASLQRWRSPKHYTLYSLRVKQLNNKPTVLTVY
jgi:hypothetical protein